MVKELKNKLKVSDDALGWVMEWKRGRLPSLLIGWFMGPQNEPRFCCIKTIVGSRTEVMAERGWGGEERREIPVWVDDGEMGLVPRQMP